MSGNIQSRTNGSTSRSLLRRAKEQDAAAWQRLTTVYTPLVYQWCRRSGLQVNDAADVAQEVFRSVARGLAGFQKQRPEDTFHGWLWTITRNKIRDHFRAIAGKPDALGGTEAQARLQHIADQPPSDPDDASGQRIHSKLARHAITLMQTDFQQSTWQAFWYTAVEQEPPQSVADRLNMSVAAVYKAKSRVLRHLRDELDGLDLLD